MDCISATANPSRARSENGGRNIDHIPDAVLQSKTPNRFQRSLPPDAIEISFQYADPAKAQAVANDLGNIMIDEYRKELEHHNDGDDQADFE